MKSNKLSLYFAWFFVLFFSGKTIAQLGVNATNAAPNASAMLDVESPNKGILIPRMSTATRDGIASPPDGLMIYNNLTKKFNYFNNTAWQEALFGNQWAVNGSNISYSGGNVGIGISNPAGEFVINSATGPAILFQQNAATGNTNNDGFFVGSNSSLESYIWNYENAGIRFGTNNLERMVISSTGNLNLTGEINRPSSGAANLIPIAYGSVQANGTISGGTGNFSITKLGVGIYEITIPGENIMNNAIYHFSATALSANPQFATAYPFSGKMRVETFEPGGSNVDGNFSFFVYKP